MMVREQGALPGLKPARRKAWPPREIDRAACLAFAEGALSLPPAREHIERAAPAPGAQLLARFVLPLELCKSGNPRGYEQPWQHERVKKALHLRMLVQLGGRPWAAPAPGRPFVRCIRFSSVEPDAFADSFKAPVDILTGPDARGARRASKRAPRRLNVIADDNARAIRLSQHWEPAPQKHGFGLIEVWSS